MDNNIESLFKLLAKGPTILFIGQNYLKLDTVNDPILTELSRKYYKSQNELKNYSSILEIELEDSRESIFAWLHERCKRLPVPKWLDIISRFAWSNVYTSSIDTILQKAFENEWREIQPIFEKKYMPCDPRNKSKLHLTYLFGRIDKSEENEMPPLDDMQLLNRKALAIELANRIPEIVTPIGNLFIDGYDINNDWFSLDSLIPIILNLGRNQVHFFNASEDIKNHSYFKKKSIKENVIFYEQGLAEILTQGESEGYIKIGYKPDDGDFKQVIKINNEHIKVPVGIWNQVSKSAIIIDNQVIKQLPKLSENSLYLEFRNFLSSSNAIPQWEGYKRGFAFQRNFEAELYKIIIKTINEKNEKKRHIILHGQTGTGKTIALGNLAMKIKEEGKYPVLFIERKFQRPQYSDIEMFCNWAEESEAEGTIIIWDGMLDFKTYNNLIQYLLGCGKKILVIGSSYFVDQKNRLSSAQYIEAPSNFDKEKKNFYNFICKFDKGLEKYIKKELEDGNQNFLVALYRLLPQTRNLIKDGVKNEITFAEREINKKLSEKYFEPEFDNIIGNALLKVGAINAESLIKSTTCNNAENIENIKALIGFVMLPGKFGLKVPFDLLLRTLKMKHKNDMIDTLNQFDIFRWFEDNCGNIFIGPRHPLEAELFIQHEIKDAKTEIEYAKKLIFEVNDFGDNHNNIEIQFIVELIRNIGPSGHNHNRSYYADYYIEISNMLEKLRKERSIFNPRLILQEVSILREYLIYKDKIGQKIETAELCLKEIVNLIEETLKSNNINNLLRSKLLVAMGSTFATMAKMYIDTKTRNDEAVEIFKKCRKSIFEAISNCPENHHAIDVFLWASRDILNTSLTNDCFRYDIIADAIDIIATAESGGFGFYPTELLEERKIDLGEHLNLQAYSDEAFDNLIKRGSSAGYYIRAYKMVGKLPSNCELNSDQAARCTDAFKYLNNNWDSIKLNGKCLNLFLKLWWMLNTGKTLFYGERQCLPFKFEQWQQLENVISYINSPTNDNYITPTIKYLLGITYFHLKDISRSIEVFDDLERDSNLIQGSRRIIRSYLASNSDGTPIIYNGSISHIFKEYKKGDVYVDDLRRRIKFIPAEFGKANAKEKEAMVFHIAFNFRGIIIDPTHYYKK